jgi:hypothetical protein
VAVVIYQDDGYGPVPKSNAPEDWSPFLNKAFAGTAEPIRRILAGLKPGDYIYSRPHRADPAEARGDRTVRAGRRRRLLPDLPVRQRRGGLPR